MSWARPILRAVTVLVAIPFFYLVFGLVGGLIPGPVGEVSDGGPQVRVGLARGPIHYDFLLPLDTDLRARFSFLAEQGVPIADPRGQWLMLGWGAREFYTATGTLGDISIGPVAHAITGDTAVMRLDVVGKVEGVAGVRFVTLSTAQYSALLQGIEASFARDTDGLPVPLAEAGFGLNDAFYTANGQFNIFYTCNAWLGAQLRAAGVPMGIWTPTPQSVELSLWWLGTGG